MMGALRAGARDLLFTGPEELAVKLEDMAGQMGPLAAAAGRWVSGDTRGPSRHRRRHLGRARRRDRRDGAVLAQASAPLPAPACRGGLRQDPELWWSAVARVIRAVTAAMPGHRVVVGGGGRHLGHAAGDRRRRRAARAGRHVQRRQRRLAGAAHQGRGTPDQRRPRRDFAAGTAAGAAGASIRGPARPAPGRLDRGPADRPSGAERREQRAEAGLRPGRPGLARLAGPAGRAARSCCPTCGARDHARPGPARHAAELGLAPDCRVVAGTTDGCASFLATGADAVGRRRHRTRHHAHPQAAVGGPVFSPEHGVYSHRLGDRWLVGGASNSGGKALLRFFSAERMAELTPHLEPDRPTGLHWHPLPEPGERFPVADPAMTFQPEPRPADETSCCRACSKGSPRWRSGRTGCWPSSAARR